MNALRLSLIITLGMSLAGCSQHWRDADPGVDGDQVDAMLDESLTAVTQIADNNSAQDSESFKSLASDPNTTIFFAESNSEMGEPKNLVPFFDLLFLGTQGTSQYGGDVILEPITKARVFFLDRANEDGSNENAMLLDLIVGDRRILKIFFSDPSAPSYFENGEFVSQMASSDGAQIVIRSFDVDDDALQSVIQLKVYDFDENGDESLAGKITTLVAFGN